MALSQEMLEEINVLSLFNIESIQSGIKVHHSANPEQIDATARLFNKGLITQVDGGYLTDLGIEAAEHAQSLLNILKSMA